MIAASRPCGTPCLCCIVVCPRNCPCCIVVCLVVMWACHALCAVALRLVLCRTHHRGGWCIELMPDRCCDGTSPSVSHLQKRFARPRRELLLLDCWCGECGASDRLPAGDSSSVLFPGTPPCDASRRLTCGRQDARREAHIPHPVSTAPHAPSVASASARQRCASPSNRASPPSPLGHVLCARLEARLTNRLAPSSHTIGCSQTGAARDHPALPLVVPRYAYCFHRVADPCAPYPLVRRRVMVLSKRLV